MKLSNSDRYQKLADGLPKDPGSIPSHFELHKDGALQVVWAPLDHINSNAKIIIIGITPGWQQAQIAYTAAQQALKQGASYINACKRAKGQASFAGTMRKNLVAMLNEIGVVKILGIDSTDHLFGKPHPDLHTTSALRYPVFHNNKNYTGHTPHPLKNDYLRSMVETLLVEELKAVAPALVVPLGKAANQCVKHALAYSQIDVPILDQFPHPSGANGHRERQFKEQKRALSRAVNKWGRNIKCSV